VGLSVQRVISSLAAGLRIKRLANVPIGPANESQFGDVSSDFSIAIFCAIILIAMTGTESVYWYHLPFWAQLVYLSLLAPITFWLIRSFFKKLKSKLK